MEAGKENALSARTLGQIALIQGMVVHLPDKEQVLRFVCRGLGDVPGVASVRYTIFSEKDPSSSRRQEAPASSRTITLKLGDDTHGELVFALADAELFSPYIPFIENLGHILSVVIEERRQRSLNKEILENLEKSIYERTRELEQEIIERRQAESAMREKEENLRITLNSIGDAVISTDTDGNITRMNPVAENLTGWRQHEALRKPLQEIFKIINEQSREPVENPVDKVLQAGKIVGLANHTVLISKSGVEYQIADSGAPIRDVNGSIIGVVLVFRDVTEQLRNALELLKAKKLESIGLLAGGIAHDFNNFLTGVFGNIEMAKLLIPVDHKAYGFLDSAGRSMDNAVNLTKQLLTFAKGGDPVKDTLSLGEIITDTATFVMRGSKAKLHTMIAPDLWLVEADKGQISQVISNLVINADQAMPTGGTISISAQNNLTSAGRFVEITVKDEGIGIAPQYLDKIFDPYFTTKQKGNGLGLATTHSIISKHNGRITVESQLQQGTIFSLYLPATEKTITKETDESLAAAPFSAGHPPRILVLDDDADIRAILKAMLERMGCEPAFAVDGQEVIQQYRDAYEAGSPYDAVISDLTIPGGMGGQEAAAEILRIDPQAKIIVSSGYATDPVMANYTMYGFAGIAVKPYKLKDLLKIIKRVVES